MSDNVLILGAGFSCNAGIPMLGGFIERMLEYSFRKTANGEKLTPKQIDTLIDALKVREELDGYHGRVTFDDRNIEDILSMLAFNILGGGRSDTNKFKAFTNAISETIELSCDVTHPGYPTGNQFTAYSTGSEIYRNFWRGLFNWYASSSSLPTIITFNYDLVLERSLLQVLINKYYNRYRNRVPFDSLTIDYNYKYFPPHHFDIGYVTYGGFSSDSVEGTKIIRTNTQKNLKFADIEILKLHGSLNFPQSTSKSDPKELSLTMPIEDAYILPPVSNKSSNGAGNESWRIALNRLRVAKNVVFVGYSLPKTDMYMQFFLKAALGPNRDLNKIYVFDPVLWQQNAASQGMRQRFESCFAEQIRPRIDFNPTHTSKSDGNAGTTAHFVQLLNNNPTAIFF